MKKSELILEEASSLISKDRHDDHGPADKSFERIAKFWSLILDRPVQPHQVAQCMIAVKLSRINHTSVNDDNWIDIAGYAALGGEIAQHFEVVSTAVGIDDLLTQAYAPNEYFDDQFDLFKDYQLDENIFVSSSSDIFDFDSLPDIDCKSDSPKVDDSLFFWGGPVNAKD
tara:strand:- start:1124 stop:1633 length:510 start_codon:yes stop_codon:yes gene_type:complete